ncbi:hypothetical protein OEA41_009200 [Lepraria neglecta]|uniref:Uncharacterized protein n=1 Tax=Lepraria neglecta TaxID=209136 RepID=A0AAD9Z1J7_9LECA|nr:hypothetical protein OEA41_009200 [Lepraria neglecta]
MLETYASLVNPVAKLDIRDLLKGSPSPPSRTTQAPSFSRSISVPSNHPHVPLLPSPSSTSTASQYSASTAPTNSSDQHQRQQSRQLPPQPIDLSKMPQAVFEQNPNLDPAAAAPNKRPLAADDRPFSSPAKKQSKWSPAEDAEIIRLRGSGMKWEDISKKLRGRSAISCRLHYQNYLERRSEWDEEKRNRLARVYDRLKHDLWNPIANELGIPWRACEAMHWAMGEHEMARRANAIPFAIAAAQAEPGEPGCGRVAQRDRMLESTRVFEGRDLTTLSSPFHSVNGNGHSHSHGPAGPGTLAYTPVTIPPIKGEQSFSAYDEEDNEEGEDDDEQEGPRARRRRVGGETRLPGVAEMEGEIAAFTERGEGKGPAVKAGEEGEKRRLSA